jgi:hypothetical protein
VAHVGHAELGDAARGGGLAHGPELLLGCLEGGFQPGDFTEPSLMAGFGDAGLEVVADLEQTG